MGMMPTELRGTDGSMLGLSVDPESGLKSGVYRIVCTSNGKVYVGSAVNIAGRWNTHRSDLAKNRHHSRYLQRAWIKYGAHAFAFEVIEWVEVARLIEHEQFHINAACAATPSRGFNISPTAGSRLGTVASEETLQKMRGRKISEEHRRKLREAMRGRKFSEEHRRKIGEAGRGRKFSDERLSRHANAMRGRKHTGEARRKMSESHRGRKLSEEHKRRMKESRLANPITREARQKISERLRGRPVSEETRQKTSISLLARRYAHEDIQGIIEARRNRKRRPARGWRHTDESRKKMSEAVRDRGPVSEETRQRLREAHIGRKHSEETKQKCREINLGREFSEETRQKMSEARKGKSRTAAQQAAWESWRAATPIKEPAPCMVCSKPSKPLRKGRCHACNEYLRRKGHERPPHLYSTARECLAV